MVFTTETRRARRQPRRTTNNLLVFLCEPLCPPCLRGEPAARQSKSRSDSRHRVELRHIPSRRPAHESELVQPHHRIVTELEVDAGELRQRLKELGLLFEKVQRHLRVQ